MLKMPWLLLLFLLSVEIGLQACPARGLCLRTFDPHCNCRMLAAETKHRVFSAEDKGVFLEQLGDRGASLPEAGFLEFEIPFGKG